MEAGNPLLDDYVLSLTGVDRPKVCFLPTASGDADHYIVRFYRHFACSADASHVSLFRRDRGCGAVQDDLAEHLLAAGPDLRRRRQRRLACSGPGGRTGSTRRCAEAWRRGVVLCGLSRGLAVLVRRVADRVPRRARAGRRARPAAVLQLRALRRRARAARASTCASSATGCAPGYAAEDGAALHFEGDDAGPRRLLARGQARAFRVDADGEHELEVELPRRAPRGGAREPRSRRSSPWAAAASRWSPTTPRWTTSRCR